MNDPTIPAPVAEIDPTAPEALVFIAPRVMSVEERARWVEDLRLVLPYRKILILPPGTQVHDLAAEARIEQKVDRLTEKVDALLHALAADEEGDPDGDEPLLTLDGESAGAPRDPEQSLG
jgi:hypothetical protein